MRIAMRVSVAVTFDLQGKRHAVWAPQVKVKNLELVHFASCFSIFSLLR